MTISVLYSILSLSCFSTDATAEFTALHGPGVLPKYTNLVVGKLSTEDDQSRKKKYRPAANYTVLHSDLNKPFGCTIPFSEPYWYRGIPSPYYTESHAKWRAYLRGIVDKHFVPYVSQWEEQGTYPPELHTLMGQYGLNYAACR